MAETYYSLTDIVKHCDNLVAAMPTSFYSGIMAVRTGLANIPAADVVARDCYDKILIENDDMRAIIDTYGGLENIQSAFVKLHEIEAADVVPVVRCKDCVHSCKTALSLECEKHRYVWDDHPYFVDDDNFCCWGARKDGDGDV